jgi:hypothetical protein
MGTPMSRASRSRHHDFHFRLSEKEYTVLHGIASTANESIATVVRQCIREFIKRSTLESAHAGRISNAEGRSVLTQPPGAVNQLQSHPARQRAPR